MTPRSLALALTLSAVGCASRPVPCAGAGGCPKGHECLASRCAIEGGAPVPAETRRFLLTPAAIAIADGEPAQGVAASVTLGAHASAPSALYLRFEQSWRKGQVRAAFLLLEPRPGALAGQDVPLEVWRTGRRWTASSFRWSEQPGFAPPFALGIGRAAPALPVRVDVTEIVRYFAQHPSADHGFVVRAGERSGAGITLSTGVDGGAAPRLDVYLDEQKTR